MYNTFDIKGLGERIRFHRQRVGLTQTALAEKINVSFQAISGWENSVNLPDIENLCNLSTVFGISVDELLRSKSCVDEQFMIGIDGGGTKTEFVLFSSEGKVLKSFRLSGTNASLVGLDATLSILFQGIDICMGEKVNVCGVCILSGEIVNDSDVGPLAVGLNNRSYDVLTVSVGNNDLAVCITSDSGIVRSTTAA